MDPKKSDFIELLRQKTITKRLVWRPELEDAFVGFYSTLIANYKLVITSFSKYGLFLLIVDRDGEIIDRIEHPSLEALLSEIKRSTIEYNNTLDEIIAALGEL